MKYIDCALLILFTFVFLETIAQDNNLKRNEIYPDEMFVAPQGRGRILDVTKLTSYKMIDGFKFTKNADPNDSDSDDSEAINEAVNWVANRRRKQLGEPGEARCVFDESWIVYFPNGVYNLKHSIGYTVSKIPDCAGQVTAEREGIAGFKFVGQSREKVIVKLMEDAVGFNDLAHPQPVIRFADPSTILNNAPAGFQFRNFTVDCGNFKGVTGVDFYGANNARLDNVLIKGSNDAVAGLDIRIATAHGYYSNITINGFESGLRLNGANGSSAPSIEYVSLSGQKKFAIKNNGCVASMRKIFSDNECTALLLGSNESKNGTVFPSLVMIDCEFKNGGKKSLDAVLFEKGYLFLRNISLSGYKNAVIKNNQPVATLNNKLVKEYISERFLNFAEDGVTRVRKGDIKSLNLPVEEVPMIEWQPLTKWKLMPGGSDEASEKDEGPEINAAIQQAVKEGKTVLYFPKNFYNLTTPVTIPAQILQLIGADTHITSNNSNYTMTIADGSQKLLLFNGVLFSKNGVTQTQKRTIYFEGCRSRDDLYEYRNNTSAPNLVFINNGNRFATNFNNLNNVTAYARFIDNEQRSNAGQYNINGKTSSLWVLGCKSEPVVTIFRAANGARLEVLGAISNRTHKTGEGDNPVILNENANVSVTWASNGYVDRDPWTPIVKDTQNGYTFRHAAKNSEFIKSRGYSSNIVLPAYFSYKD